jgi:tyrosyl-tRNA synthetase
LHGAEAARLAAETARRTFEEGALAASLPTVDVPRNEFDGSIGALNAFMRAGLVASNGEARRLIQSRGLSVNGVVVDSDQRKIGVQDIQNGVVKLSLGRKKHVLLRPK